MKIFIKESVTSEIVENIFGSAMWFLFLSAVWVCMYFQPCTQKENYWELQIFLTHSASPPFLFHALWHNFLVLSQSVRYYFSTTHGQENIFLLWRQLFLTSALASSLFFCICEPMEFLLINLLLRCCSVRVCVVILAIYQNWDQFQVGSRGHHLTLKCLILTRRLI